MATATVAGLEGHRTEEKKFEYFLLHQLHGEEDHAGAGEDQGPARLHLGEDVAAGAGLRHRQLHDGPAHPSPLRDAPGGARRGGLLPQTAAAHRAEDGALRGGGSYTEASEGRGGERVSGPCSRVSFDAN